MDTNTLRQIPVSEIAPNPHNPRLTFDEKEMEALQSSIKSVGVLVPLTLYENKKKVPQEKYILLDGERRWRCAKMLGIETIPANIIDEPEDITQNILYMFNIHHFRTEWEIFPTALKLEIIIQTLKNDNEITLSEFTGLSRSTIRRCKMLLWYPTKYREELLGKNSFVSPDFLIELYPIAQKLSFNDFFTQRFKLEDFIDKIAAKYKISEDFQLKDLRDIRRSLAYYEDLDITQFIAKLEQFLNSEIGLEIFVTEDMENNKTRKSLIKSLASINEYVKIIKPDVVSDIEFRNSLSELLENLKGLFERIE